MNRVVCPGSFDPITFGHLDIIERASRLFDEVVIAVLVNQTKSSLFTVEERMEMIREVTAGYKNVQMSQINLQLKGIETLFMSTAPAHSFLSSSLVKEIASYDGDVSSYIPEPLVGRLRERLALVKSTRVNQG